MAKKKRLLLLLFVPAMLFANSNYLQLQTEHFDIVFRPASSEMAAQIYSNCENVYEEVTALFDTDPGLHIPVFITDDQKILNAYFSAWPYNRIVLYDTLSAIDSLSHFKDSFISIFKHELTHAVQFNTVGKFWRPFQKTVNQATWQQVYCPPYITEGLAVYSESQNGYGRLNDKNTMKLLTQATLENKFPDNIQISGAYDLYPSDRHYLYGGAFFNWLALTYGQDSINNFIKLNGSFRFQTTYDNFFSAFGIKLNDAWEQFKESIEAPSVIQPESIGFRSGLYTKLTELNNTVYGYDKSIDSVFCIEKNKLKTLTHHCSDYMDFSVLYDGSLALPLITECEEKVFIKKGGKTVRVLPDARAAFSIGTNGANELAVYSVENQNSFITIYDAGFNCVQTVNLGYGVTAGYFCLMENGLGAMILSKNAKTDLALLDAKTHKLYVLSNPEGLQYTGLSASGNNLCFSYADTFPCYGKITINNDDIIIQTSDVLISGGINCPVLQGSKVNYIAMFSDKSELCCIEESGLRLNTGYKAVLTEYQVPESTYNEEILSEATEYSIFSSWIKPSFIPTSSQNSVSLFHQGLSLGLSVFNYDLTGTLESDISAGYNLTEKQFQAIYNMQYKFSNRFSLCTNAVLASQDIKFKVPEFDATVKGMTTIPLRSANESFDFSESAGIMIKSQKVLLAGELNMRYRNLYHTGMKYFDYSGIIASSNIVYTYTKESQAAKISANATYYFNQHLIDHLSIGVHADYDFMKRFAFSGSVSAIPLNIEIQNGFLNLYFNRFTIKTTYDCIFIPSGKTIANKLTLDSYLTVHPVLGAWTEDAFNIGMTIEYDFENKPKFSFLFNSDF